MNVIVKERLSAQSEQLIHQNHSSVTSSPQNARFKKKIKAKCESIQALNNALPGSLHLTTLPAKNGRDLFGSSEQKLVAIREWGEGERGVFPCTPPPPSPFRNTLIIHQESNFGKKRKSSRKNRALNNPGEVGASRERSGVVCFLTPGENKLDMV